MLNFLSAHLMVVVLLLATLLVLVLLVVVVSAALSGAGRTSPAGAERKLRLLGALSLRRSFDRAVALVEANLAAHDERYNLSWTLLLNESSRREVPLAQSGLPSALSAETTLSAAAQGLAWHFFDKGVVVQLQADFLGAPDAGAGSGHGIWDALLGQCRQYRPQRPFDGIVLAIPCAVLLSKEPQAQLELMARAKAMHRRLWLAQNRLALRFPIHLVLTECEVVPGFASFGAALPEPMRRSMLGWASPYELVAPFHIQWVDTAMDQIVGALADGCAELCAQKLADADSSAYFLLPSEVERLRAGLKLFCEELMRPSAYHEPFLLRGIYLTGDSSDAAALAAGAAGTMAPALPDPALPLSLAAAKPPVQADPGTAPPDGMPVFLRDIFEHKIFAEVGLVVSSSQRMRRPVVNRLAYWSALLLPVLWAIGLTVATFQLHFMAGEVQRYLAELNSEPGWQGHDARRNRQRATDALLNIEQLGSAQFRSLFMPGSWPPFDDLHSQVRSRLEQGFAENAFEPLRRSAFSQFSRLTGVALDPNAGSLIAGAQCALPEHWDEQSAAPAPAALNLEELPQYMAMLQYLKRVDDLDAVVNAMQRLKGPSSVPASGADLVLVARALLGVELNGTPKRAAALFRREAQDAPQLEVESMQAAVRCSLHMASMAMYRRLFDDNGLLREERVVLASTAGLLDRRRNSELAAQLDLWTKLRQALDEQQAQLMPGKGGWMHRSTLNLGAVHDAMLERIGRNTLLGQDAARDSRLLATEGYGHFLVAWRETTSAPSPVNGAGGGLEWSEAGSGWVFTAQRKELHDAVSALMSQPYMRADAPAHLAEVPSGATVNWDKAQLERAASLAEARKAFQGGAYGKLPAALQQPAGELLDLALGASVHSTLAQALGVAGSELPSAASDAERASVLRLRGTLDGVAAAELDATLSRDAMTRLQRMDQVFSAAQVFVPRDPSFRGWQGEKGALRDAFAAGDAAALAAYLAQQQEFLDIAARQVDGVLAQLGATAAEQPVVARWLAIAADLRRYRLKSPTSSLIAIGQFIVNDSTEIDIGNCTDKLSTSLAQRHGTDLLAERLQNLQSGLLARCRGLVASHAQKAWEQFAERYNGDLARRAPFVALPAGSVGAMPVDLDEVGAVMKLYDRARAASAVAERDPLQPLAGAAVRKADQQLRRVRDVFAPLYPDDDGQAGGLDVVVQFRANPGAESKANQIIDWRLSIGGNTVRLGDPVRALRWQPGMPVLLSLRLARDGTSIPKADQGRSNMTVAERTVSYRCDDPWALFTFIDTYRVGDAPGNDGRAPLLRFEFPVINADAAVSRLASESQARVFLRLSVSAPGKRSPLPWPVAFPAQAPPWQESTLDNDEQRRSAQAD